MYGFYGAEALGGSKSPLIPCGVNPVFGFDPCAGTPGLDIPYSTVLSHLVNSSGPNKGVGFNFTVPIRNRQAQAQADRAQLEYRQSQMRLQQLYVQLKMQVTNQIYALQNDRAHRCSRLKPASNMPYRALDAEQKKYRPRCLDQRHHVLSQTRNLETAQDNLIEAQTAYAVDRASLSELVADTLQKYGINITDAATGNVSQEPECAGPGRAPAGGQAGATPSWPRPEWKRYGCSRKCNPRTAGLVSCPRGEKYKKGQIISIRPFCVDAALLLLGDAIQENRATPENEMATDSAP